jgi:small subunit ribosomal protein S9
MKRKRSKIPKPKEKTVHVSGKRKRAIARATLKEGKGVIKINSQPINVYGNEFIRMRLKEPLMLAGDYSKKISINVNVHGGGFQSQAEAVRLTIARGMVEFFNDDNLRKKFLAYDRHLLIADDRQTEPHKPCRSSARRGKQTSKR